jgi:hypothetical protein
MDGNWHVHALKDWRGWPRTDLALGPHYHLLPEGGSVTGNDIPEEAGFFIQSQEHPNGDYWATAVACLYGLTPADRDCLHRQIGQWWSITSGYLVDRGLPTLDFSIEGETSPVPWQWTLVIATGKSPRGDYDHSVLMRDGKLVWDPHPSGHGLAGNVVEMAWPAPFTIPRGVQP